MQVYCCDAPLSWSANPLWELRINATVNYNMPWEVQSVGGTFSNATKFFKKGISTRHFYLHTWSPPPPFLPPPPHHCPETALWLQYAGRAFLSQVGCSGLIMTNECCDQVVHDQGKSLQWRIECHPLTGQLPHPLPWSPGAPAQSTDRGPEEGGGRG